MLRLKFKNYALVHSKNRNAMMTPQPTMAPNMPKNEHVDIPGNPSTAKSSAEKLNDRSNGQPLRVLTEEDWTFWITNGYIFANK